jgi:hypothetical protein
MIFILITITYVSASNCTCNYFCKEEFSCYFGECTDSELQNLDCRDASQSDGLAEMCPVCPACGLTLGEDCVNSMNEFIYSDRCIDQYKTILISASECRQTIQGSFKTEETRIPLTGVTLTSVTQIDGVDFTNFLSQYYANITSNEYKMILPRCGSYEQDITLAASKKAYGSDVQDVTLQTDSANGSITGIDFNLKSTSCDVDCTDSFNRCNPDCEGYSTNSSDDVCEFFSNEQFNKEEVIAKCAYKLKGTPVVVNTSYDDKYTVIECCEGPIKNITRPKSDIRIKEGVNLVSVEKPVRIGNSEQGTLKVFYWNEIDNTQK